MKYRQLTQGEQDEFIVKANKYIQFVEEVSYLRRKLFKDLYAQYLVNFSLKSFWYRAFHIKMSLENFLTSYFKYYDQRFYTHWGTSGLIHAKQHEISHIRGKALIDVFELPIYEKRTLGKINCYQQIENSNLCDILQKILRHIEFAETPITFTTEEEVDCFTKLRDYIQVLKQYENTNFEPR